MNIVKFYYECDKKSENLFQFESEFDADEIQYL